MQSFIKRGRLIALASVSPSRLHAPPQVPTVTEAGLKYFSAYSWNGLFAPAGAPEPILEKLHDAVEAAMKDPTLKPCR